MSLTEWLLMLQGGCLLILMALMLRALLIVEVYLREAATPSSPSQPPSGGSIAPGES
jgi:hypothetical protein